MLLGVLNAETQTVYFSENFDSGTLPQGWNTIKRSGSIGWQVGLLLALDLLILLFLYMAILLLQMMIFAIVMCLMMY